MIAAKLALGGAQFGMAYGITNTVGQPSETSLKTLLDMASKAGVDLIDTAPSYGESEAILGRLSAGDRFRIVTKTLPSGSAANVSAMLDQVRNSLTDLKQDAVEGLLFHNADVLTTKDGEKLYHAAHRLKMEGIVSKLGASVYDTVQVDELLQGFDLDLVQVPMNLLDMRLIVSGALDRLKASGVEVHARSAFLQGILLSDPDHIPERARKLRPVVRQLHSRLAEMRLSPLEACLGYLASLDEIDRIVVGVVSPSELSEILSVPDRHVSAALFADIATDDAELLDPRFWS
ncbi:aldo/keto reductase [Roseitalea porphyridii]|uniref:Aldo/keto reductase n=1 Tax=Roseitalea porphyridii TaxID=1852022 RepID=A0A4P6V291_9HYPH|nr:aldo/keto reductase [Roseitalea porphyridii]QBK30789.1 aldo/keto reductase [Roseitalea porphyridii]